MNDTFDRDADAFAFQLADETRSVGLDTGLDLALSVLYLRWVCQQDSQPTWDAIVHDLVASGRGGAAIDHVLGANIPFYPKRRVSAYADGGLALRRAVEAVARLNPRGDEGPKGLHRKFEALLRARAARLSRAGAEHETPSRLATLMADLVQVTEGSVLDPACGIGNALMAASEAGAQRLVGYELNATVAVRTFMRFKLAGVPLDLRVEDGLLADVRHDFDAVVMQPPWGAKLHELHPAFVADDVDERPGVWSADQAWLRLAHYGLSRNGRAAVLMPVGSLTHMAGAGRLRAQWLDSGILEAIITLPRGAVAGTGLSTCLWLLRAEQKPAATRQLLVLDASPLVQERGGPRELDDSAHSRLVDAVMSWRNGHEPALPPHIAGLVNVDDLRHRGGKIVLERYLDEAPIDKAPRPVPSRRLLSELRVSNFKSFGPQQSVPLGPITLLYGPNSAGKSSLLQALLLMKQSAGAETLVTQGSYTDAGSFVGAIHRHETDRVMRFGVTFGSIEGWEPPDGVPDPSLMRHLDVGFGADGSGLPRQMLAQIGFGDWSVRFDRIPSPSNAKTPFTVRLDQLESVFSGVAEGTLLYPFDSRHGSPDSKTESQRLRGRQGNARRALRRLRDADLTEIEVGGIGLLPSSEPNVSQLGPAGNREQGIVNSYVNRSLQLTAGTAHEFRSLMAGLAYLGPLRSAPQRFYNRAAATAGARTAGEHIALHLFDNASEVQQVNDWLRSLGVPYALKVTPVSVGGSTFVVGDLVAIILTDLRSNVDVSPADVGFGVSQVLPIVVELLANQDRVICIEQPEIHLHPALQAELGDLLIESTAETGRGNQVIVETHSEHLILRLQRRIREGALDADQVAVVYVDQNAEGQSIACRLRLDADGDFLDEWPQGFFEERLEELFGDMA